jgi:hypothetical protein
VVQFSSTWIIFAFLFFICCYILEHEMSVTEGVLVVIVILLLVFACKKGKLTESMHGCRLHTTCPADCPYKRRCGAPQVLVGNGSSQEHHAACGCAECRSYEKMGSNVVKESVEYFQVCGDKDETSKMLDCVCGGDDKFTFATNEYGAPGMDYKSFVTSQAVDDKVIANHIQYVQDRKALGPGGLETTGRTYSPDSHDSYDPIPWVGLRRPEYVQQCNPTQVPDVNTNIYKGNRQFCFKT